MVQNGDKFYDGGNVIESDGEQDRKRRAGQASLGMQGVSR
jgi:hypothetical protein